PAARSVPHLRRFVAARTSVRPKQAKRRVHSPSPERHSGEVSTWLPRLRPVAASRAPSTVAKLHRGPQPARARARIVRQLARGRFDGTPRDELCKRLAPADADRKVGWADTAPCKLGKELLDAAVL